MPKVSVLLTNYNGEKHLDEAISSVLAQTYTDFEFIIIDDASTDSSKAIIDRYKDVMVLCQDLVQVKMRFSSS